MVPYRWGTGTTVKVRIIGTEHVYQDVRGAPTAGGKELRAILKLTVRLCSTAPAWRLSGFLGRPLREQADGRHPLARGNCRQRRRADEETVDGRDDLLNLVAVDVGDPRQHVAAPHRSSQLDRGG